MRRFTWFLLVAHVALGQKIAPVRVWNDQDLAEWATPVAGLNVRPGHYSEHDYYAAPVAEWVSTYPVYFPGREPNRYFESLEKKKPEPLIQSGARQQKEWIRAGQIIFHEMDVPMARSYDPDLIVMARSADALTRAGARAQPDGTIIGLRWVPTSKGLALSVDQCAGCHTRVMPDGTRVDGAPLNGGGHGVIGQLAARAVHRVYGDSPALWSWRSSAVPWLADDVHEGIRTMQPQELRDLFRRVAPGAFADSTGALSFQRRFRT